MFNDIVWSWDKMKLLVIVYQSFLSSGTILNILSHVFILHWHLGSLAYGLLHKYALCLSAFAFELTWATIELAMHAFE